MTELLSYVRCRLQAHDPGDAAAHGVDSSDPEIAAIRAAIESWASSEPLSLVSGQDDFVLLVLSTQIADTLSGCCETLGEIVVTQRLLVGASGRERVGASRTIKVHTDSLLEQLTHLSHLVVNQCFYTLCRHPRIRAIDVKKLDSGKHRLAKSWLEDSKGPIKRPSSNASDWLSINASKRAFGALQILAKETGDLEMTAWVDALSVFFERPGEWTSLASVRGKRHHWLAGHVTPGLLTFPQEQTIGGSFGSDRVRYLTDSGWHDPADATQQALDGAIDTAKELMKVLGSQLSVFHDAWRRARSYLDTPPHTDRFVADKPPPAENGTCFPYRVRFALEASDTSHDGLEMTWFGRTDRPATERQSYDDESFPDSELRTVICAKSYLEAEATLKVWIDTDGYELMYVEPLVLW